MDAYENDLIIASESGFAQAQGTIDTPEPECPKCHGNGYTGTGRMTMTPSGPEDDTAICEYCNGSGKAPEMVLAKWSCPDCGEARQDYLVWDDDCEWLTCQTCFCVYGLDEMTDAEQRRESR